MPTHRKVSTVCVEGFGSDKRGSVNLMPVGMATGPPLSKAAAKHRRGQLHGGTERAYFLATFFLGAFFLRSAQ